MKKMKMKEEQRAAVRNIIAYYCESNNIWLEWLKYDTVYDLYKNGYFDEDMKQDNFNKKYKDHKYEEDSFNENDLDEMIEESEKTLVKLKKIREGIE